MQKHVGAAAMFVVVFGRTVYALVNREILFREESDGFVKVRAMLGTQGLKQNVN